MRLAKRAASSELPVITADPQTDIAAANYADRAKAFVSVRGGGFVIRAVEGAKGEAKTRDPATDAQWFAWMAYLDVKFEAAKPEDRPAWRNRKAMWANHGLVTVPCEWPEDFDVQARSSSRDVRLARRAPVREDQNPAETADYARRAVAGSAFPRDRRRDPWKMTPDEADAFIREAASKPIAPLSAAAMKKIAPEQQPRKESGFD